MGTDFEQLNEILDKLSKAFDDPTVGQQKQARRSQIYDNLIHIPSSPTKPIPAAKKQVVEFQNDSSSTAQPASPTGKLTDMIDMLNHYGGSSDSLSSGSNKQPQPQHQWPRKSPHQLPGVAASARERSSSDANLPQSNKSDSRSRSASGDDDSLAARRQRQLQLQLQHQHQHHQQQLPVGDVSVVSGHTTSKYSHEHLNESWSQMVSAADNTNGDYIDLIPFMDEDVQSMHSAMNEDIHTADKNDEVILLLNANAKKNDLNTSLCENPLRQTFYCVLLIQICE